MTTANSTSSTASTNATPSSTAGAARTMTPRERTIALVTGSIAAVFVIGLAIHAWFVKPMRAADAENLTLERALGELEQLETRIRVSYNQLAAAARRTHGDDPATASAATGKRLTELIARAGLDGSRFTRLPLGATPRQGAREIGWNVQGVGPKKQVVDLLFLLESDPSLQRIDNLTISPRGSGEFAVSFRYLTLVLVPPVPVERVALEPGGTLDGDRRALYDAILRRDLFRPYVKRPPPPPAPEPSPKPDQPPAPTGPGPETFRIVSLSQWRGESEILVRDATAGVIAEYSPGDELAGGRVVRVDYRPLPLPRNPDLVSSSRVIISIGDEYWAIERGDTLADRYRLPPELLPADLKDD